MMPTWSIAAALSLATLAGTGSAIAGDVAYGEYLSSECVTCHQPDGTDRGIPSIVGWHEESMVAVLNSYKARELANPVMQTIAGGLGDDEIAALAAYFATLEPAGQ